MEIHVCGVCGKYLGASPGKGELIVHCPTKAHRGKVEIIEDDTDLTPFIADELKAYTTGDKVLRTPKALKEFVKLRAAQDEAQPGALGVASANWVDEDVALELERNRPPPPEKRCVGFVGTDDIVTLTAETREAIIATVSPEGALLLEDGTVYTPGDPLKNGTPVGPFPWGEGFRFLLADTLWLYSLRADMRKHVTEEHPGAWRGLRLIDMAIEHEEGPRHTYRKGSLWAWYQSEHEVTPVYRALRHVIDRASEQA